MTVCNILHLPRTQLKSKIIDCPEILQTFADLPVINNLVHSFYDCNYASYMNSIAEVENILLCDRYLSQVSMFVGRCISVFLS